MNIQEIVNEHTREIIKNIFSKLDDEEKYVILELNNQLQDKINKIGKLQQENKQLKERFERLVQEHIDTITRNEEKQQRIDKAIEYIKNEDIDVCTIRYNDIYDTKNELLEILGGD